MKKLLFMSAILLVAGLTTYGVSSSGRHNSTKTMLINGVEALASCEVKLNDKVVFQCDGDIGRCSGSYKKYGQKVKMSCSGKKSVGDDDD